VQRFGLGFWGLAEKIRHLQPRERGRCFDFEEEHLLLMPDWISLYFAIPPEAKTCGGRCWWGRKLPVLGI
jgi:hypothetical protein